MMAGSTSSPLPVIISPVRTKASLSPSVYTATQNTTARPSEPSSAPISSLRNSPEMKSWATRLFEETWAAKSRTMDKRGFASPKAVKHALERQRVRKLGGGSDHYAMPLEPAVKNPLSRGTVSETVLVAPWLTSAQYKGRRTKWREEFKAARRNYSAEDLRMAAANIVHEKSLDVLNAGNEKWKWTERLIGLVSPDAVEKALPKSGTAKADENSIASRMPGPRDEIMDIFAEKAYTVAPVPLLSRPRFIMAAQQAFNLDVMKTEGTSDPKHLALVKGIVDSWGRARTNDLQSDRHNAQKVLSEGDHVDTRSLLAGMNLVSFPFDDVKDHLSFAFGVHASNGLLQRVRATGKWYDLKRLGRDSIEAILRDNMGTPGMRLKITGILSEAWRIDSATKGNNDKKITLAQFQAMLDRHPFGPKFLERPPDPDRVFVDASQFEEWHITRDDAEPERYLAPFERMYSPFLVKLLARERKAKHVHNKMLRFLLRWRMLAAARTFEIWWVFTDTRLRARALMTEALERWTKLTYRSGWNQLRSNVVKSVCASDIARVYRGHWARSYVRWMRSAEAAAIYIQGIWRGRSRFLWFMRKMRRRDDSARLIQRYFRGHRGRQVADRVLREFYRVKKAQIDLEKRRWRAEVRSRAATRINSIARGYLGRKFAGQKAFERDEKRRVEKEMEDAITEQHRKQILYEQKMANAFKKRLSDQQEEREALKRAKAWKRKIFMAQHLRRVKAKIEESREENEEKDAEDALFWGAFDDEWNAKLEADANYVRRTVAMELISKGDTNEQIAKFKATKVTVKNKAKEIRKEAIAEGRFMNQSMAKKDAKEWYVQQRIEESAKEVLERKQKKKDKIQAERDEEWDLSHAGERAIIADQKLTLVKKLQSLWTIHKARKKQAKLLDGLWRLECDVESQELYYLNTRDGTVRWDKPILLGSKELDPPNRWYECRDVNGVTFYYHPYRMDATYEKPWDYDGDWYDGDMQDASEEQVENGFDGLEDNGYSEDFQEEYSY